MTPPAPASDGETVLGEARPALPNDSPALRRRAQRVPLPLLADPSGYVACPTDLTADAEKRAYWLELFRTHFDLLGDGWRLEAAERGIDDGHAHTQLSAARGDFFAYLDAQQEDPARFGRLDILSICWAREDALQRADIDDAYAIPKRQETERALKLLPGLLGELDCLDATARFDALVRGVFAGNIFDLGAKETIALFENGGIDFEAVRGKLKPRPWRFDDYDALAARFTGNDRPYRCAALFVDNAGPDVLLGMLPLARELLRRGVGVVLTANTRPSLNDVTHDELVPLVEQIARWDAVIGEAWRDGRLEAVASGNDAPLIDLGAVCPELAEVCGRRGVDLVVLEGMGRALESNFDARLACDTLKVCMIKDLGVARTMNAEVYDLVLRFEPGAG